MKSYYQKEPIITKKWKIGKNIKLSLLAIWTWMRNKKKAKNKLVYAVAEYLSFEKGVVVQMKSLILALKIYAEHYPEDLLAQDCMNMIMHLLAQQDIIGTLPENFSIEDSADHIIYEIDKALSQNPSGIVKYATLLAQASAYHNRITTNIRNGKPVNVQTGGIYLNPIIAMDLTSIEEIRNLNPGSRYVFTTNPTAFYFSYSEVNPNNPSESEKKIIKITEDLSHINQIKMMMGNYNFKPISDDILTTVKSYIENERLIKSNFFELHSEQKSTDILSKLPSFSGANQYFEQNKNYTEYTSQPFQWSMRYKNRADEINTRLEDLEMEPLSSTMRDISTLTNQLMRGETLADQWNDKLKKPRFRLLQERSSAQSLKNGRDQLLAFICCQNINTPYGIKEENALEISTNSINTFLNLVLPQYYPEYFVFRNNQLCFSENLVEPQLTCVSLAFGDPNHLELLNMNKHNLISLIESTGTKDKELWAVLLSIQPETDPQKKCDQINVAFEYINTEIHNPSLLFQMARGIYSLHVDDRNRGAFTEQSLSMECSSTEMSLLKSISDLANAHYNDLFQGKREQILNRFRNAVHQTIRSVRKDELALAQQEVLELRRNNRELTDQVEDYKEEIENLREAIEILKTELLSKQRDTKTSTATHSMFNDKKESKVSDLIERFESSAKLRK